MKETNCNCNGNCENHDHDHECCENHDHDHECCEIDEIELVDEDGNVLTFELEEWFEFNGKVYAVLIDENDEALLFESVEEDGEYSFVTPSEDEFEEVKAYYENLE